MRNNKSMGTRGEEGAEAGIKVGEGSTNNMGEEVAEEAEAGIETWENCKKTRMRDSRTN